MSDDGTLFKRLLSSKFKGCTLLAETIDQGRKRPVKIYLIDTRQDVVGINDSVDCWIATPTVSFPALKLPNLIKNAIANIKPVIRQRVTLNQPIQRRKLIQ